jgi:hypothetical protein
MNTISEIVALYRAALRIEIEGESLMFARAVSDGGLVVLQQATYDATSENFDWLGTLSQENQQELASLNDSELQEYAARRSFLPGVSKVVE